MQIKSDFTKEELMKSSDVLGLACFPLGKIQMLAEMFHTVHFNPKDAEDLFNSEDNLHSFYTILKDAKKEIELLIDVANEQNNRFYEEKKV